VFCVMISTNSDHFCVQCDDQYKQRSFLCSVWWSEQAAVNKHIISYRITFSFVFSVRFLSSR